MIFTQNKQKEKRRLLRQQMTKAEILLWVELKDRKILGYKFRRQFSIGFYVLDFYCPVLRLAIEVDGATHATGEEIEYDKNRQSEIENLGIKFLRFNNFDIYTNKENVIESIIDKINEMLSRKPLPSRFHREDSPLLRGR